MKRQNLGLQSKIKLLEEEMESLHAQIGAVIKERNSYRKEIQMNLLMPHTRELSACMAGSVADTPEKIKINRNNYSLTDPAAERFCRSNSLVSSTKYWQDLTNGSYNNWDINHNTGYLNKFNLDAKPTLDVALNCTSHNNNNNNNIKIGGQTNFGGSGGSVTTDLNSVSSTPRSYK